MVDPAVATETYSYHGSRRVVTRMARRMSGPPKVGTGELSRIVRKKSPNAPRWRNIEKNERPRFAFWSRRFNIDHRGDPVLSLSSSAAILPLHANGTVFTVAFSG